MKVIGTSYRLVVRFKKRSKMEEWEKFFKSEKTVGSEGVLHVETRVKEDAEKGD